MVCATYFAANSCILQLRLKAAWAEGLYSQQVVTPSNNNSRYRDHVLTCHTGFLCLRGDTFVNICVKQMLRKSNPFRGVWGYAPPRNVLKK